MSEATQKVYLAIAEVMGKLAVDGISKARKNTQQNYSFRGIDDIFNTLAPMLSSAKLLILPRVLHREVTERATKTGGALFYVVLDVEFDFVAAEDGSKHIVRVCGEAMDSADKATNKAMSAAFKYACLQAFCIPTEGDNDADATTHEVISRPSSGVAKSSAPPATGPSVARSPHDLKEMLLFAMNGGDVDEMTRALDVVRTVNSWSNEEKLAVWPLLDSKTRTAYEKFKNEAARAAKPQMLANGRGATA